MENIYKSKNIKKEDIDNIVKVIHNKYEKHKTIANNKHFVFTYNLPHINLNNIRFSFRLRSYNDCNAITLSDKWRLEYIIFNDNFYNVHIDIANIINSEYFESNTIKELIVKYVNSEFVYDKCDNKIMRYEDYLDEQCIRKIFHSNIECCVCHDNMSGDFQTKCNHDLCLECYNKLKGFNFNGKKICPYCRACLCCGEEEDDCNDY